MHELRGPLMVHLSRRQFLTLLGIAAAAGGAVPSLSAGEPERTHAPSMDSGRLFELPTHPNHNPGFQARDLGEAGVLLWTNQLSGRFKAYRLNMAGRMVWRLCDATRSMQEVSKEYERRSGRSGQESEDFLKKLIHAGIVVTGSHIVASHNFVVPHPGHSYHIRLTDEDPEAS